MTTHFGRSKNLARIRSISEAHYNVRVHPTEVDCTYQTVYDKDGTKYLQLTTYGSDSRKSRPKSSQTIQMDEHAALELAKILLEQFKKTE